MGETREELERKLQEANKEEDKFKVQYYQSQLNALDQAQAADKALQEQASAVITGFALPQDYDAYTGLEGMNGEITALITQVSEQLNAVYLAERESLQAAHRDTLASLQANIDEVTGKAAEAALELVSLKEQNYQLSMDLNDASNKRDAAVAMKEEAESELDRLASESRSLKSQIDELEGIVRTLKKSPAPSGGLKLTSTLKLETDEERKARLQKQQLEVINRNMSKYGLEPLKMPGEPIKEETVTPEALDAAFQSVAEEQTVVRADGGGEDVQAAPEPLETAGNAEAGLDLKFTTECHQAQLKDLAEWRQRVNAVLYEKFHVEFY
ncbi:hypothetical protein D3C72_245260 [compost metagenome]